MTQSFDMLSLPIVNRRAAECSATIRNQATDFQVNEILPFEPSGEGEHVYLQIRKTGVNTNWLAAELAKFAGVPPVAIGVAGMKDRHAVTTQWFSIKLAGQEAPDWTAFETDQIEIIQQQRHARKLKRGVLLGNDFQLILRDIMGDRTQWETALEQVAKQGVPNYFGGQRFGHGGNNLRRAAHWFSTGKAPRKRTEKSMYLSAARSWLFNQVLAARLAAGTWNQPIAGDVLQLAGTKRGQFSAEDVTPELTERAAMMDIHPTGVLWGRGESSVTGLAAEVEHNALVDWADWQAGMERAGLEQARRALRLMPQDFQWQFLSDDSGDTLQLNFQLPAGAYATSLLRELAVISDVQQRNFNAAISS